MEEYLELVSYIVTLASKDTSEKDLEMLSKIDDNIWELF